MLYRLLMQELASLLIVQAVGEAGQRARLGKVIGLGACCQVVDSLQDTISGIVMKSPRACQTSAC